MSETAHTPGPWEAIIPGWKPWDGAIEIRARDGMTIAWMTTKSNEVANSDLIAAAPDMLVALREAVVLLGNYARYDRKADDEDAEFTETKIDAFRAAIAKAEGQS